MKFLNGLDKLLNNRKKYLTALEILQLFNSQLCDPRKDLGERWRRRRRRRRRMVVTNT
jgi:hypothetical protein